MPKQINTPTAGQALVEQFSLKGRYQPVLDETIVPVVLVPTDVPVTKLLATGGQTATAAGAGNQNIISLFNPTTTGVLVTLEHIIALSGTPLTDTIHVSYEASISQTGSGSQVRDSRDLRGFLGVGTNSVLALTKASKPASAVQIAPYYIANGEHYDIEWIISPGYQLNFRQSVVNTSLLISFEWFETSLRAGTGF